MNTMLEFMTLTKGVEYLIAIAFLIVFIAFWRLVYGRGKGRVITIALLSYMVLAISILAGSCITMAPQ